MFRVFDTEENQWIKDVYMGSDGKLFLIKRSIFGRTKAPIELPLDRYVCHTDIGLTDKNNYYVLIGDYVIAHVAEDRDVIGMVTYATELSAYIILCEDSNEYFTLGSEVTEFIEIIGNVFDGYVVDNYGESALQEPQG